MLRGDGLKDITDCSGSGVRSVKVFDSVASVLPSPQGARRQVLALEFHSRTMTTQLSWLRGQNSSVTAEASDSNTTPRGQTSYHVYSLNKVW